MRHDLARTTLGVLFIVAMIAASLWIMRPFLVPVIWATMIVVATWPLMLKIEAAFGRRRMPTVAVITVAMLLVFVLPFWTAVSTIVEYSDEMVQWAKALKEITIPQPPDWVAGLPVVGDKIAATWKEYAAQSPEAAGAEARPLRRARPAMARGRGRRRRGPDRAIPADDHHRRRDVLGRRNRGARRAQVRRPARRPARRGCRRARVAGDTRRGAGGRGHGARPVAAGRSRPPGSRRSVCRHADRRHAAAVPRPAWADARARSGDRLGVLDRRQPVGHAAAGVDTVRGHARQFPAPVPDQAGRRICRCC